MLNHLLWNFKPISTWTWIAIWFGEFIVFKLFYINLIMKQGHYMPSIRVHWDYVPEINLINLKERINILQYFNYLRLCSASLEQLITMDTKSHPLQDEFLLAKISFKWRGKISQYWRVYSEIKHLLITALLKKRF